MAVERQSRPTGAWPAPLRRRCSAAEARTESWTGRPGPSQTALTPLAPHARLAVAGAPVGAHPVLLAQAVWQRAQLLVTVRIVAALAHGAVAAACKRPAAGAGEYGRACMPVLAAWHVAGLAYNTCKTGALRRSQFSNKHKKHGPHQQSLVRYRAGRCS